MGDEEGQQCRTPAERQDAWLETRDNGEATEVVGRKEGGKEGNS